MQKSLKPLRTVSALVSIVALTLVFVDITGTSAAHLGWLAHWQLIPALLAVNVVVLVVLAVATLLFGRLYCSVICPLGIFQDVVSWLRRRTAPRRRRAAGLFRYRKAATGLRYSLLALMTVLLAAGLSGLIATSFAGLLDPYSAYGRIAGQLMVPAWRPAFDAAAALAAENGTFITSGIAPAAAFSWPVAAVAGASLLVVVVMAWMWGRRYCTDICPVGTLLGVLSRWSLFRPVIDTDRCNGCGRCGRTCKAQCIDTRHHEIDMSRCVVCMDCIGNCTQNAITYRLRKKSKVPKEPENHKDHKTPTTPSDPGRRSFLVGTAIAGAALAVSAADKTTDGGLSPLLAKQPRRGLRRPVPPGAPSLAWLTARCTACQLCVSACPQGIIKPDTSAASFMQPRLIFTGGYCLPGCTRCSEVCPTGALKPLTADVKAMTSIGTAIVDADACLMAQGVDCGNCARRCPAGAITIITGPDGRRRPVVDESRCIGCGSCEYHCPVGLNTGGPSAAICVQGRLTAVSPL
ncbi:MAG: 4Fe-4S binding protein [Muribaculaceae bacterium]|nr:4Fe-4S binding protein [Muribaculaceae bacterium]